MDKNVGGLDRNARLLIGAILLLAGVAGFTGLYEVGLTIGLLGLLVGAILFVTGTTQKCPINSALGMNTYER